MEGSNVPCKLWLRGVVVVVGLTLFLGGFSSEDKTKEVGLAALFLSAVDFPFLSVSWGVKLNPVSKLSKFVCSDVNTGGGENSHLSSLRNAWGECIGVAGGVLSLPKIPLVSLVMELLAGKDHSPLKMLSHCSQCQVLHHPVYYPCCIHFTYVNPSFRFLIKRIPDEPPCYIPWVWSLLRKDCCIL